MTKSGVNWGDLLKFIGGVLVAAIPFIVWDKIEKLFEETWWTRFIFFPLTIIVGIALIILVINIIRNGTKLHWSIWSLLVLYIIILIIGAFVQGSWFFPH
jgi:hypothetical protein